MKTRPAPPMSASPAIFVNAWFLPLFFWLILAMTAPAAAESGVSLDGTMGGAGPLDIAGPYYEILETHGARAGSNLFHSLKKFDIGAGETADFRVGGGVENIVARVTGGGSRVDGTLTATLTDGGGIAGANLFLLNPAGVIFGAEAALNLGGSFYVSTADYLGMEDGERIYSRPMDGEVLSAAPPAAFGFLDAGAAPVVFEGARLDDTADPYARAGLSVAPGKTLAAVAGEVRVEGIYVENYPGMGNLTAEGGLIGLSAVAGPGETGLDGAAIAGRAMPAGGPVALTDNARVLTSGDGGGQIRIRAGQFVCENSSIETDNYGAADGRGIDIAADTVTISSGYLYSDTWESGAGGSIVIRGDDFVKINNDSQVFADTRVITESGDDSAGRAGNVTIESGNIVISSGSTVSSDSYGTADGGWVMLRGAESVTLSGDARVFTGALGEGAAAGDGGTVRIETPDFSMTADAKINSDTYYGGGTGGAVEITGLDGAPAAAITVDNSQIFAGAIHGEGPDAGAGGTVSLNGAVIRFVNGGRIRSESTDLGSGGSADGAGGDIHIAATRSVTFSGVNEAGEASRAFTTAEGTNPEAGDAGDIRIFAPMVIFSDGGGVTASTRGPGMGGAITVTADVITLDGVHRVTLSEPDSDAMPSEVRVSGIDARSESLDAGAGDGGQISVTAGHLSITDGASITSGTLGPGAAGTIAITAEGIEMESGGVISSESVNIGAGGAGGAIDIAADTLFLTDAGTKITTETAGAGRAGDARARVGQLVIKDGAAISSASVNPGVAGDAGTVTVEAAGDITIGSGGAITTEAGNAGGGRMAVTAGGRLDIRDGMITTSVQFGAASGGDIDATAGVLLLRNGQIIAKAYEGRGGNIHIISDVFIASLDSVVSASSTLGIDGMIFNDSPITDISSLLAVLPNQYMDAGRWIAKSCAERYLEDASRFILAERKGVPSPVDDWLAAP